jgi:hypothetical protein
MSRLVHGHWSRSDLFPRFNEWIAMLRRCTFPLLFVLLLGGCAARHDMTSHRPAVLKQSHAQFDLHILWDVTTSSTEMRIDGLIRNVWSAQIEELELRVDVLDPSGKTVARSTGYVSRTLGVNETAPFSLIVPAPIGSGSKLLFTYRYIPGGGDTDLWMQSFESSIPAD